MPFITQRAPHIRRKLQKLEAGPQTPLSTLAEEAFKVYNNWDVAEEANRDGRLIKKTQLLAASIHLPHREDPSQLWRPEQLPRDHRGRSQRLCFPSTGTVPWKRERPGRPPVESPQGHPWWPPFPVNRSLPDALEIHRHLLVGMGCQPVSGSYSIHPHYSRGASGHPGCGSQENETSGRRWSWLPRADLASWPSSSCG